MIGSTVTTENTTTHNSKEPEYAVQKTNVLCIIPFLVNGVVLGVINVVLVRRLRANITFLPVKKLISIRLLMAREMLVQVKSLNYTSTIPNNPYLKNKVRLVATFQNRDNLIIGTRMVMLKSMVNQSQLN